MDRTLKKGYDKVDQKVRPVFRKMITGDKNKKVRLYLKEPSVMRYNHRMSFCVSILCMMLTQASLPIQCLISCLPCLHSPKLPQALILTKPHLMPPWYVFWVVALMSYRLIDYKKQKYHLFLLDFCYFVQVNLELTIHSDTHHKPTSHRP